MSQKTAKKQAVARKDMTKLQWTWHEMKRNKVAYGTDTLCFFAMYTGCDHNDLGIVVRIHLRTQRTGCAWPVDFSFFTSFRSVYHGINGEIPGSSGNYFQSAFSDGLHIFCKFFDTDPPPVRSGQSMFNGSAHKSVPEF